MNELEIQEYQWNVLNSDGTITLVKGKYGIDDGTYRTIAEMSGVLPIPRDFAEMLIFRLGSKR